MQGCCQLPYLPSPRHPQALVLLTQQEGFLQRMNRRHGTSQCCKFALNFNWFHVLTICTGFHTALQPYYQNQSHPKSPQLRPTRHQSSFSHQFLFQAQVNWRMSLTRNQQVLFSQTQLCPNQKIPVKRAYQEPDTNHIPSQQAHSSQTLLRGSRNQQKQERNFMYLVRGHQLSRHRDAYPIPRAPVLSSQTALLSE